MVSQDTAKLFEKDSTIFRQVDYLWLFNPMLGFSQRGELSADPDESNLTIEDYKNMHLVNRSILTSFFSEASLLDYAHASKIFCQN